MKEIKPPDYEFPDRNRTIFLADSIEMDTAEKWQDKICKELEEFDVWVYNPRRDSWDSSWEQKIDNPQFREQVDWELDFIHEADIVFFYFDPNTKSPISLMELGYCLGLGKRIVVYCPEGFWRKGNVDIICDREGEQVFNDLEKATQKLKKLLA